MRLSSGEIVGVEALLRWRHPTRGIVAPADFIPAAENIGAIHPIGRWALNAACHQAAAWKRAYAVPADFSVTVNVSVCQLRREDLVADVIDALASSGLAPEHLALEMTEGVLSEDTESTLGLLQRIHALGVRLAIDDFGTGSSPLTKLQRFPFDTLKIDRAFLKSLASPDADDELVRMLVALGHSLRMVTVAEAIEHPDQLLALREMGCELGQGFLLAQPGSAGQIAARLADSLGERDPAGAAVHAAPSRSANGRPLLGVRRIDVTHRPARR